MSFASPSALNCLRNSFNSSVKFRMSAAVGNSQSISNPSNRPAAEIPGATLPLMNRSIQEATSCERSWRVLAA